MAILSSFLPEFIDLDKRYEQVEYYWNGFFKDKSISLNRDRILESFNIKQASKSVIRYFTQCRRTFREQGANHLSEPFLYKFPRILYS